MTATFQTDGALNAWQGGNGTGAACTGIGTGSNQSGPIVGGNFTATTADFIAQHIGGAATSGSASNTGNVIQEPLSVTAGSGYTDGTYRIQSDAGGGQTAGCASITVTVSGGALTAASVHRPGSGFSSAPTFTLANGVNLATGAVGMGAGTLGDVTATVGLGSRAAMLGAAFGSNKGTRYLTASGSVANGAAVSGGYLNRSGRTMAAGDSTWAVAP